MEVQDAIDLLTWDRMLQAARIHATDPEGTDISWTIKPNYWEEGKDTYRKGTGVQSFNIVHEGHISAMPLGMGPQSFEANDADGVIAGTLNHAGPFPHIRMVVSRGGASGIEGGGEYGRLWREGLSKWANVQFPGTPGPGKNKLWEVAIGTNTKAIRPRSFAEEGGSWERARSGVIHWGVGARTGFVYGVQQPNEWEDFSHAHPGADGHAHIHTYFTTLEVETADGQIIPIISKGRLTALDDPGIRQIAAKYGDPDELLQEIWIPGMPGINTPGDYWETYANDPVSYIRKEIIDNYPYE